MATMVLSSVGSSVGSSLSASFGAQLGRFAGAQLGGLIDNAIAGTPQGRHVQGVRLRDLAVQSSTYGEVIPKVYGTVRMGGNIIWAQPITENSTTVSTASSGGKGGPSAPSQTTTTFSYSATLAIAICTGEIDEVVRAWADAKLLNPDDAVTFRLHKGSEDQLPDPLIESIEGMGNTPAYRGMAYVVIENFPLADYGNRIPNFTFEVRRRFIADNNQQVPVEELVTGMTLIPGAGEFVYDDTVQSKIPGEQIGAEWVQKGNRARINQNNRSEKADGLVALDQLQSTCPNVSWVSVVVVWFGDSVDAGDCIIKPGVEYNTGATTDPDVWEVAGFNRSTAKLILQDVNGNPQYGGTPSDNSLIRYLKELKARGYNILFNPMFFMDTATKPWRGRVTGDTTEASTFFTKTNGYNAFINHYATLVKDDVDAFVIGSELIGLTSIQDVDDSFPAVDELVGLAASVKTTVGSGVSVTYAADWSEYHHADGGWYHLDPLWASSHIDMIGIDAYFPLTDAPQSGYDVQEIIDGWTSGEGYDWYYTDEARTIKATLEDKYAWKNIAWWWENNHINPDMSTTAWVPESKKIWFVEYGFPSVDGAANQPNVFYDPNSEESAFPRFSKGRVDVLAQRTALLGTELQWQDSDMIEHKFIWTWDARPYPFWPDLTSVWTDGNLWSYGHWVQGKLGLSNLGAIVDDVLDQVGVDSSVRDTSELTQLVDGYVLTQQLSARQSLDHLRTAYFFDAVERNAAISFVNRGGETVTVITADDLLTLQQGEKSERMRITRKQELELPQKVDVLYMNRSTDYQSGTQHAQRLTTETDGVESYILPVVLGDTQAKTISDVMLYHHWLERTHYELLLPNRYAYLEPTDLIEVTQNNRTHTIRVTETMHSMAGMLRVKGVAEDSSTYSFNSIAAEALSSTKTLIPAGETVMEVLDIPTLVKPEDADKGVLRYAVAGLEEGWHGASVFRSDDGGTDFSPILTVEEAAAMGVTTTILPEGVCGIIDRGSSVTVSLYGSATLESLSQLSMLNGGNLALIGEELVQFQTATLVEAGVYTLSNLLRGRFGTEHAMGSHDAGERFVVLDARVQKDTVALALLGLQRDYKSVSIGAVLDDTASQTVTYQGLNLKPYAPVHIKGERDGSGNLVISWVRRARINGEWRDNVDVPIGEAFEQYEIDIMDGETVMRTIRISDATQATYDVAEQTADFGSPQSAVMVHIYQLSEAIYRGSAAVISV